MSQRETWRREKVLALAERFRDGPDRRPNPPDHSATGHHHRAGDSRRGVAGAGRQRSRSKRRAFSSPRSVRRRCRPARRACASRCPPRTKNTQVDALDRGARGSDSPHEHTTIPRSVVRARSPRGGAGVRSRERELRRGGRAAGARARRARWRASPSSRSSPATVLDLGAGTGHATRALKRRFPKVAHRRRRHRARHAGAREGAVALAAPLRARPRRRVFAAVSATASFDLVFSSLMLQWCDDLDAVFARDRARAQARRRAAVQHVRAGHAGRAARGLARERRAAAIT